MNPTPEKFPQTHLCGMLQIRGYFVTEEREEVAKLLANKFHTWTPKELEAATKLSKKTIGRILKLFRDEKLIHHSSHRDAYFACQKPYQAKPGSCHSFGVCEKCGAVQEFIHNKHQHPRMSSMKVTEKEHEWQTYCLTCSL